MSISDYFELFQEQNLFPTKKDDLNRDLHCVQKEIRRLSEINMEFMPIKEELQEYQRINFLEKGEIFGEISCMTKLERTCTIVTKENTLVHCLKREDLDVIQEMFPKIYNSIYDKM